MYYFLQGIFFSRFTFAVLFQRRLYTESKKINVVITDNGPTTNTNQLKLHSYIDIDANNIIV